MVYESKSHWSEIDVKLEIILGSDSGHPPFSCMRCGVGPYKSLGLLHFLVLKAQGAYAHWSVVFSFSRR